MSPFSTGATACENHSTPTDKHVGNRVRMRRLMLGVSQTKLADALGITFQQVQKYEKGANRIKTNKLQQISNFLRVPIPFFSDGLPGPSNKAAKKDGTVPPSDVFQFMATVDGLFSRSINHSRGLGAHIYDVALLASSKN